MVHGYCDPGFSASNYSFGRMHPPDTGSLQLGICNTRVFVESYFASKIYISHWDHSKICKHSVFNREADRSLPEGTLGAIVLLFVTLVKVPPVTANCCECENIPLAGLQSAPIRSANPTSSCDEDLRGGFRLACGGVGEFGMLVVVHGW